MVQTERGVHSKRRRQATRSPGAVTVIVLLPRVPTRTAAASSRCLLDPGLFVAAVTTYQWRY